MEVIVRTVYPVRLPVDSVELAIKLNWVPFRLEVLSIRIWVALCPTEKFEMSGPHEVRLTDSLLFAPIAALSDFSVFILADQEVVVGITRHRIGLLDCIEVHSLMVGLRWRGLIRNQLR